MVVVSAGPDREVALPHFLRQFIVAGIHVGPGQLIQALETQRIDRNCVLQQLPGHLHLANSPGIEARQAHLLGVAHVLRERLQIEFRCFLQLAGASEIKRPPGVDAGTIRLDFQDGLFHPLVVLTHFLAADQALLCTEGIGICHPLERRNVCRVDLECA